jgi:hypothetical protein
MLAYSQRALSRHNMCRRYLSEYSRLSVLIRVLPNRGYSARRTVNLTIIPRVNNRSSQVQGCTLSFICLSHVGGDGETEGHQLRRVSPLKTQV